MRSHKSRLRGLSRRWVDGLPGRAINLSVGPNMSVSVPSSFMDMLGIPAAFYKQSLRWGDELSYGDDGHWISTFPLLPPVVTQATRAVREMNSGKTLSNRKVEGAPNPSYWNVVGAKTSEGRQYMEAVDTLFTTRQQATEMKRELTTRLKRAYTSGNTTRVRQALTLIRDHNRKYRATPAFRISKQTIKNARKPYQPSNRTLRRQFKQDVQSIE